MHTKPKIKEGRNQDFEYMITQLRNLNIEQELLIDRLYQAIAQLDWLNKEFKENIIRGRPPSRLLQKIKNLEYNRVDYLLQEVMKMLNKIISYISAY